MNNKFIIILFVFFANISIFSQLTCNDLFTDSGGENAAYVDNENIITTICPISTSEAIELVFSEFIVEGGYDFLTIYDSENNNENSLGTFTGNLDLGTFVAENPSGCLRILFTSDSSVPEVGWIAEVNCVPAPTCRRPINLSLVEFDSTAATLTWEQTGPENQWLVEYGLQGFQPGNGIEILTTSNPYTINGLSEVSQYDIYVRAYCNANEISNYSNSLTFTTTMSPLLPFICSNRVSDQGGEFLNYSNNTHDTITICPENLGDAVFLNFTFFNTEKDYDSLIIYSGDSISSNIVGVFSGDISPGIVTSQSENGCLTLIFNSDQSISGPGWMATISCQTSVAALKTIKEEQIFVYPNPSSGNFSLETDETFKFTLKNIEGKIFNLNEEKKATGYEFDLTEFENGIYFLIMENETQVITTTLIKQ